MIQLRLSFGADRGVTTLEINDGELLKDAVTRAVEPVPKEGFEVHDMFVVTVNGMVIDKDFWPLTKLNSSDEIVISPRIGSGESGQIFKQAIIITIAVVASVFLGPAVGGGVVGALTTAAVTIGATLLLNAMIPPPVPDLGPGGFSGSIDNSQMYNINGQSNQMKRLGTVPKVYGNHRMFPLLAVTPYTELSVDPITGETIQYFYSIYDFGLGTAQISDIKIGDTPLSSDSFQDFEVRLVDPNRPDIPADIYDQALDKDFIFYRGRRVTQSLSLALLANSEFIQFSDENPDNLQPEIVLDFVAPKGLYGFSSNGQIGSRIVEFKIEFAKVGTDDWKNYNDLNFVDFYSGVAGGGGYEFRTRFFPATHVNTAFYEGVEWVSNQGRGQTISRTMYVKPNQNQIRVDGLAIDEWFDFQVGYKIFYGTRVLGAITDIQWIGDKGEGGVILTLDRNITDKFDIPAYEVVGTRDTEDGPITWSSPRNTRFVTSGVETLGAAFFKGAKASPVYSHYRFTPKEPGQYKVRVRRIRTTGQFNTQFADDVTWIGFTTAYKTAPIATEKRHVFLELKIRATNQINGNIQNLSATVSSVIPVYDADTQTWSRQPSSNPAWVFCDLLTGEVNKRPIALSRLHMPSISEWAEFCDEVPDSPSGVTFVDPRFTCNFILDYETTLQGVLNQVANAAQASLNIIDGKYGVLIDRRRTTPVQIFTPRNSREFSSTRLYSVRPHGVRVKYIDPNLNWEVAEAIAYDNGYNVENATQFDELTAFACTSYDQAWRFGRYMIAQNRLRQETITILVDFENLVCTRGDYVQVTQDVMCVGGSPARVRDVSGNVITIDDSLDINPDISYGYVYRSQTGQILTSTLTPLTARTFQLNGDIPDIGDLIVIGEVGKTVYDCVVKSISPNDDLSANVTLIEKADAIYDYESTDTIPDYDPQISDTSRPDFYPPKAVTNLTVGDQAYECAETQSGYNYYVELTWDIPFGSVYEFFEIWVNDGRGYRSYDRTTSRVYKYNVDQSRLDIEHGFKVVAVSASGKKLDLIAMPEVTTTPTTKNVPPSNVANLNMSITNQVLQLSWPKIDDCDCSRYELRYSPDSNDIWESSVQLVTVSKDVDSVSVQARTGAYFIKAVDFAGNQSAEAAVAITTIPNLFDLNIIETLNDAPDFDGTLDLAVKLGEAVILEQEVTGDPLNNRFYSEGYYTSNTLLDLGDVYTVRLQSLIRADGYKLGELMSTWLQLADVESLNSASSGDWDVQAEYRATDVFAAMSDWERLDLVDSISYGAGLGFTEWRPIPTIGDATGRIFQFRVKLSSFSPDVSPRLFDSTIKADMPDRIDSFENLTSSASEAYVVTYAQVFKGPGTSPNVQISIDNAETGDYWEFDYKTLEGFAIRFYDKDGIQVSRQFDVVAKGYGRRHTSTI